MHKNFLHIPYISIRCFLRKSSVMCTNTQLEECSFKQAKITNNLSGDSLNILKCGINYSVLYMNYHFTIPLTYDLET